jgi:hypothetical protein
MATVPARRSILTGRRVWPFRDWRPWPDMVDTPGWQPIDDLTSTFTSALKRAGYWTAYVTWLYARTNRWAFVSENRGRGRRLYDLARDPGEGHNPARRHPRVIDELYGEVVRRAGGRPPIYRS